MNSKNTLGLLLVLAGSFACSDPVDSPDAAADGGIDIAPDASAMGICTELSEGDGELVCLDRVATEADMQSVAVRVGIGQRVVKWVMPARADTVLPAVAFVSTRRFPLHADFLKAAFPDVYGAITGADYADLFFVDDRPFIAGHVSEVEAGRYAFSIVEDASLGESYVTRDEAIAVWTQLTARFDLGDLNFNPFTDRQRDAARIWTDLPFDIEGLDTDYQAYNTGRGCGYIRLVALDDLQERVDEGSLSFRDIVVLDGAPADLERIVSAIVTAEPQGPLSHLAVRSAARGTPNVFVRDQAQFAALEDELACLDVMPEGLTLERTDLATAEAFWASLRPDPVELAEPDLDETRIPTLRTLAVDTAEARRDAIRAYGAKGTNLSVLYQRIDVHDGYRGVLLPASLYARFMNEASWLVDLGAGASRHSFAETIEAWLADDDIVGDPLVLRTRLDELRVAMESAPVPEDIVSAVRQAIIDVYGNEETIVRFRSSSNAEDALGFSGAGLYDSTSVCPADTSDGDDVGPSRCDAGRDGERTIERGLRRVWSSLWKMAAFEERAWYGMDQRRAVMAILINDRSGDEQANVVAFSGNPLGVSDDDRLLLTAQVGDVDLVSPVPGTRPESLLLRRGAEGIAGIDRIAQSTETSHRVLSDEDATSIGTLLLRLESGFPIDEEVPEGRTVLLDTEWKVLEDGSLVIKQIRPFLR